MMITVQQVLHPIFIMCFIVGLDFYPRKQSRIWWTVNLSILYSLTMWFAYTYFLYCITIFIARVTHFSTFRTVTLEINVFTAILSAILSRYHQKKFATCLKKLANVDDTLEKLGTPKMYQKMHTWSKRAVIGWLICSLIINFKGLSWWLKFVALEKLYMPHVLHHCIHVNTLVDLLFISMLWYIGTKFDKVNEHMQYLLVKEEYGLRCTWKKPMLVLHQSILYTNNDKRILWILMHLHLELCRLARELNLIFGTQMTLEMASCFLYLTVHCHEICRILMGEYVYRNEIYSIYDWINMGLWVLLFLVKLFIINYICESVSLKANKIDKIIHKLISTLRYTDVWKEICQFTLQIMYHQLKFTGMGLFYFGNSFLRKICMAVVTFVIIMRQMKIHTQ